MAKVKEVCIFVCEKKANDENKCTPPAKKCDLLGNKIRLDEIIEYIGLCIKSKYIERP